MYFWPGVLLTRWIFSQVYFWTSALLTRCTFDQVHLWQVALFSRSTFDQVHFWSGAATIRLISKSVRKRVSSQGNQFDWSVSLSIVAASESWRRPCFKKSMIIGTWSLCNCQNPNLNTTSNQANTIQEKLGLTWKWICTPHQHPTTQQELYF